MSLDGQDDEIANETENEVERQTFEERLDGSPFLGPTVALASEACLVLSISDKNDGERSDASHDQSSENDKNENAAAVTSTRAVHCTVIN